MKVMIYALDKCVWCQVQTSKYLLEAKVTRDLIIYSVNMHVHTLPKTASAKLLKLAAGEVKSAIKEREGRYNIELLLDIRNIERKLNGE